MSIKENYDNNFFIFPWAYFDDAFTDEEIKQIIEISTAKPLTEGTTGDIDHLSSEKRTMGYRNSKINFHVFNDDNKWIFQRLNEVIKMLNDNFYKFDISGYDDYQYSEYSSTENGKYDFHMDLMISNTPMNGVDRFRKLSLTLLLNEPGLDFEGGDFYFNMGNENKPELVTMKKGRIIVFPSFLIHKVTTVTKGVRKSLVVWVEGPKFK
jgi:PKHD-type hydroxylase